jgi:hypothetical protein
MYGSDKGWFWNPPSTYHPSVAVKLFTSLKRQSQLPAVSHAILFSCRALTTGMPFVVDLPLLSQFDLLWSSPNSLMKIHSDTIFRGVFDASPSLTQQALRLRVAAKLVELISCGVWTLAGFNLSNMSSIPPSLLPSLKWQPSPPSVFPSTHVVNAADVEVVSVSSSSSSSSGVSTRSVGPPPSIQVEVLNTDWDSPLLPEAFLSLLDAAAPVNVPVVALVENVLASMTSLATAKKSAGNETAFGLTARGIVSRRWSLLLHNPLDTRFCAGFTKVHTSELVSLFHHLSTRFKGGTNNQLRLWRAVEVAKSKLLSEIPPWLKSSFSLRDPLCTWARSPMVDEVPSETPDEGTVSALSAPPPSTQQALVTYTAPSSALNVPSTTKVFCADPNVLWFRGQGQGGYHLTDRGAAFLRHIQLTCHISMNQMPTLLAMFWTYFTGMCPSQEVVPSSLSLRTAFQRLHLRDIKRLSERIAENFRVRPGLKVSIIMDDTHTGHAERHA